MKNIFNTLHKIDRIKRLSIRNEKKIQNLETMLKKIETEKSSKE